MSGKKTTGSKSLNLKGHLLIAMPGMEDQRFARTVVLICSHNAQGSMGFILNQPISSPSFTNVLDELGMGEQIELLLEQDRQIDMFRGGPVEQGRGFVVHTLDYSSPASARVNDLGGVTATLDALRSISGKNPPEKRATCPQVSFLNPSWHGNFGAGHTEVSIQA